MLVATLATLALAVTAPAQPAADARPKDDAITRAVRKAAAASVARPAPPAAEPPVPASLPPNQSQPLGAVRANRARLTLHSAALRDAYGGAKPARPGRGCSCSTASGRTSSR